MPVTLTESEIYDLAVSGPAAGDPRTAASVRAMGQPLANRTRWLWERQQTLIGSFCPIGGSAPVAITSINTTTDRITLPGHGLVSNDPVRVYVPRTSSVPGGLSAIRLYYTRYIDADTIELSEDSGPGAKVDITSAGVGGIYIAKIVDPIREIFVPASGGIGGKTLRSMMLDIGWRDLDNTWAGENDFVGPVSFGAAAAFGNNVSVAGTMSVAGAVSLPGTTTVGALAAAASVPWQRRAWQLAGSSDIVSSGTPDAVPLLGTAFTGYPTVRTKVTTSSNCKSVIALPPMPKGGTLTQIDVATTGISYAGTLSVATYQLAVMDPATGSVTTLSLVVSDDHNTGNWGTTRTTTVTPTSPLTIDATSMYVLIVTHPHSTVTGAAYEINSVKVTGASAVYSPA